jgi:predicted GNAT superfamily acetyltransferase
MFAHPPLRRPGVARPFSFPTRPTFAMASTIRGDADRATLDVRPVASLAEYRACAALQAEVWGEDFECVPASVLQVATYVGGICLGAFLPDGELCGLVFGLSGTQDGKPMHWSHLLAVRESARNLGVGRVLKERQRELLASRGIPEMRWSFDPMIVKNAHLNLNRLGARVVRYVPDMYGITESPLHHGLATDRLVVAWPTSGASAPRESSAPPAPAPILTAEPQPDDDVLTPGDRTPASVWIEVPADFQKLLATSPRAARAWHAAVREHFLWALGHGYIVTRFHRDAITSRCFYVLERR